MSKKRMEWEVRVVIVVDWRNCLYWEGRSLMQQEKMCTDGRITSAFNGHWRVYFTPLAPPTCRSLPDLRADQG